MIYLDWNATAPIRPTVIAAVGNAMAQVGNPSSVHAAGRQARMAIETARQRVANIVGVQGRQVIFTSGATEASNQILKGFGPAPILISAIEHSAIHGPDIGAEHIPVHPNGLIDLSWLDNRLQTGVKPGLIAVMLANNETGVIQPVRQVCDLAAAHGIPVLCDAVQAAGKIPLDFKSLGCTFMTLSAHKIGGPQGVGALIMAIGQNPPKFIEGGGQERRQRAGTENVAGIVGFGVAASEVLVEPAQYAATVRQLRDQLAAGLKEITPQLAFFGADVAHLPNTICCALPGFTAETALMAMDLEGVAISSGSACSSGTVKPSHVLQAMGVSDDLCLCALRFSLGHNTTKAEVDAVLAAWQKVTARIGR
ncbi:MAG: cysteine desulfurase family protein [Pseudomonadota bacterium]